VCQFLKSASTAFPNLSGRAAEKESTVMLRVVFQHGHDEHEPLEVFKPKHGVHFEI
jgi:hypothetical protein